MCHLSEFCRKFVAESKKYLSTGQERVWYLPALAPIKNKNLIKFWVW
jgi:hypothetical protein